MLLSLHTSTTMRLLILPLLLLIASIQAHASHTNSPAADSVGVALNNGNYFIIHQVGARQTLFSLSKAYKVSIQEIMEANPGMLPAVQAGQLLYIPLKNFSAPLGLELSTILNGRLVKGGGANVTPPESPAPKEEKPIESKPKKPDPKPNDAEDELETQRYNWSGFDDSRDFYHEVQNGETLYKIAYYYGMNVQELMDLNGLENSLISAGQNLLIRRAAKKTPPKQEKQPAPKEKQPTPKEKPAPEKPKDKPEDKKIEEESIMPGANPKEINETGWALTIDKNFPEADKMIGLHLNAPVGGLVTVTNLANNKLVYVRVVGQLKSDDQDLLMMISPEAARALGVKGDEKFKIKLNYLQ